MNLLSTYYILQYYHKPSYHVWSNNTYAIAVAPRLDWGGMVRNTLPEAIKAVHNQ